MAMRAERFFQTDIALKFIKNDIKDKLFEDLTMRRFKNLGLCKKDPD